MHQYDSQQGMDQALSNKQDMKTLKIQRYAYCLFGVWSTFGCLGMGKVLAIVY
jgi:hypothetical protein